MQARARRFVPTQSNERKQGRPSQRERPFHRNHAGSDILAKSNSSKRRRSPPCTTTTERVPGRKRDVPAAQTQAKPVEDTAAGKGRPPRWECVALPWPLVRPCCIARRRGAQ